MKFSQNGDKYDFEAYCNGIEEVVASEEEIRHCLEVTFGAMFDVIDTNHDGFIQQEEYEYHFRISGLDTTLAKESFDAIDTNKNCVLSREEFIFAAVEFHRSREDTPAKYFFGPLIE